MSKMVLLSRGMANSLVSSLLVLKLDSETRAGIASRYCSEKVEVICLAKPSGRREMISYLSGFTLGPPDVNINPDEPLNDRKLKQLLVPVWAAEPLVLQVLAAPLLSLEESLA